MDDLHQTRQNLRAVFTTDLRDATSVLSCAQSAHAAGDEHVGAGELESALECYRLALKLDDSRADTWNELGNTLRMCGYLDESVACYRAALERNRASAVFYSNLGEVLLLLGYHEHAARMQCQAILLRPEVAEFHNSLGLALRELGRLDDAIECFRQALRLKPQYSKPYTNLGLTLLDQARGSEAIESFQRAIHRDPNNRTAHSALLFASNFCPGDDPEGVREAHLQFERKFAAPLADSLPPHANEPDPDRRLRIGYVSPYFRHHCQSMFTLPLLRAHQHDAVEVYCYSDVRNRDQVTALVQDSIDHWRDTTRQSDEDLARTIREDRIDILVDLTMHMAGNRALTFARKPAPVQICWLAYPGSTGMSAIDYRISDPYLDPPGTTQHRYVERTVQLADCFWCYDPLDNQTSVSTPPSAAGRGVTFGCLNNFCKVNEPMLRLWAKILGSVSGSRILLLASEGSHRDWVRQVLAHQGIDQHRVLFVDRRPREEYLRLYHQIDISLDLLPSNGHTTSLDSLWMGVPVVTLVGDTPAGRAGLSLLTNLGLEELITWTPTDYVQTVVSLANDVDRQADLRSTLRDRLRFSPLMDANRFARNLESIYRKCWHRWCATRAASVADQSRC